MRHISFTIVIISFCLISSCSDPYDTFPDPSPINYEDFVDNQDKFPAFSPDGSKIAYYHLDTPQDPDYPTGLYIINRDGTDRRLVLEGDHLDPDWSPDGKWLVFSTGGVIQKCTIEGDSLTAFDSPFESGLFSPDWTTDKTILFDRAVNFEGESNLFSMNEVFNETEPIYGNIVIAGRSPELSPIERTVVFMKASRDWPHWEIMKLDVLKGNETRLTFGSDNRAPTWSSDGQQIAWSNNLRIYIMNADGSNRQYLHYGNRPSWSVDDEIVFSFANEDMSREVLYTIKPDGSELNQITF